jgi:hypothetical protein
MISRKIRICADCIHFEETPEFSSVCKRSPIIDLVTGNKHNQTCISVRYNGNCGTAGQYFEPIESKKRDYQWDQTLENNPF